LPRIESPFDFGCVRVGTRPVVDAEPMAKQRLDERALPSDLSADAIMAEAERRLQSPRSGKANVPADWPPQNPRRQQYSIEDTASRSRMQDYKQIFPDNASLARAGRQFTVGNIGNNGRIYLRYVCKTKLSTRDMLTLHITADQLYVLASNARELPRLLSPSRLPLLPVPSRRSKISGQPVRSIAILYSQALPPRPRTQRKQPNDRSMMQKALLCIRPQDQLIVFEPTLFQLSMIHPA